MPVGTKVDLGTGDIVLDEDPAPLPKKGVGPKFSAHVYCGQTTGWIKMPVGTKVGLAPGDTVFDIAPQFWAHVCCGHWSNGWMDQDATWYEGRPRHGPHCVTGDPASPTRGTAPSPIFGPCLL